MQRDELVSYLDGLLDVGGFHDYCPNGLQVEGGEQVDRVICGVTASQALIDRAIAIGAQAMLVHHGWFWKSDDVRLVGHRRARAATLLAHDINLLAYHLPLDAHALWGNNAQLARHMGWLGDGRFGEQEIGFTGTPAAPLSLGELAEQLENRLGRAVVCIGDEDKTVRRMAWCTGAAQGLFEIALGTGAQVFISGELSEQTTHLARETGMAYIAAGHHATERYGVAALAEHLSERFGLHCEFVDIDNPA